MNKILHLAAWLLAVLPIFTNLHGGEIVPPPFWIPETPSRDKLMVSRSSGERPYLDVEGKARLDVDLYTQRLVPNSLLRISLGRDLSFFPAEQYRIYFPNHQKGVKGNILACVGDHKMLFKYVAGDDHGVYLRSWNCPHFLIRREGDRLSLRDGLNRQEYLFSSLDGGYTWNVDEIRNMDFPMMKILCEYDDSDLMKAVVLPDSSKYAIEYSKAGLVTKVTAPDGTVTTVAWDDRSQIREIKSSIFPGHPFYREEKHAARGKKDKRNSSNIVRSLLVSCDTEGKLLSLVNTDGEKYSVEYRSDRNEGEGSSYFCGVIRCPDNTREYCSAAWKLTSPDKDKEEKTLEVRRGRLGKDSTGKEIFDASERRLYEKRGNSYVETETEISGVRSSIGYGPDGMPAELTDAKGEITRYSHNTNMQRTGIAYPDGSAVAMEYDDKFRLTGKTGAQPWKDARYSYDDMGRLAEISSPEGATKYEYHPGTGMLSRTVLPDGSEHGFTWDSLVRLQSHILPDGTRLDYRYAAGSCAVMGISATAPDGKTETRKFTYSPGGLPESILYPDGTSEKFQYKGRDLTRYQDRAGNVTGYAYDSMHRKVSELVPDGGKNLFKYDDRGKTVSTQLSGRNYRNEYDSCKRLIRRFNPDRTWVAFSYDELGRKIKERYSDRTETIFRYDSRGRLVSETGDHSGNVLNSYNQAGQLVSTVRFSSDEPASKGKTTTYSYDELGRKIRTVFPDGTEEKIAYSGKDEIRTFNGRATYSRYDACGRISTVSEYPLPLYESASTEEDRLRIIDENIVRKYVYDLFGNLTEVKNIGRKQVSSAR